MSGRDWTDEQVASFRALHALGHSFAQIARAIGGGLTRSACSGKARRLGLRAPKPEPKVKPLLVTAPKRKSKPVAPTVEPEAVGPVRDFPAAQTCRYIAGDVSGQWQCCGAPAVRFDIPWCLFHLRVVFQPIGRRKPDGDTSPKKASSFGTIGRRAHAPRGSEG